MRILFAMILLVLAGSIGIFLIRKPIPFQEIIPLRDAIAVIDSGGYFTDKLNIILKEKNRVLFDGEFDNNGFCLIKDLKVDRVYDLVIKRTDLKGLFLYKTSKIKVHQTNDIHRYIVLIGASVGRGWDFPDATTRLGYTGNVILGSRAIYDFDKSPEIIKLTKLKGIVSSVIIKECAAYFPRDVKDSIRTIDSWVSTLKEVKIEPILATVIPVTEEHDKKHKNRLYSILKFNDSIKAYAKKNRIKVLDLEKAVRISEKRRYLRNDFSTKDGYHLIKKGYDEGLDPIVNLLLNVH